MPAMRDPGLPEIVAYVFLGLAAVVLVLSISLWLACCESCLKIKLQRQIRRQRLRGRRF